MAGSPATNDGGQSEQDTFETFVGIDLKDPTAPEEAVGRAKKHASFRMLEAAARADGDHETPEAPGLARFGAASTASEGRAVSTTPQHDLNNDKFVAVEVIRPLHVTEFEDPAVRARFVRIVFSIVGVMVG
uniref:Uncharacterized protein n=1 Tax=Parascaris univalens TaxID=6257 RepID=A0A915A279_PARUN